MEVSLLPELFPSGLSLVSDNVGLFELNLHGFNVSPELGIFVVHIGYKSNLHVMEGSLLLQLMPFLLKGVQGLAHLKVLKEVSNKVVYDHVTAEGLRN